MDSKFPYQLEILEGTFEIDRDQRGYANVFEVYETVPATQVGWWYEQPHRGRFMFRIVVDAERGQGHCAEAMKRIERDIAVPSGLEHREKWQWIHRRIDEICAQTAEQERKNKNLARVKKLLD